ncbi:MAG: lipoyl(octanoyl) transferase LipB, partial [Candidatus Thermoplasmatota archaeon]
MLATTETAEPMYVIRKDAWLLDLGRMAYGDVWSIQKALAERRVDDAIPDGLILVEHDHVVTLGRRGTKDDVLEPGLPVFEVERGGEATYHGPGQLVGYPILKLPDRLEVKRLVTDLEEVLLRTCADFGIEAMREGPERCVWVGGRKIASIGLAVQKSVTFHGFAHNVDT